MGNRRDCTLGELCTLSAGNAFPLAHQGARDGDHPFVKVSDMELPGNETCIRSANHWVSERQRTELRAKKHPKGSTIFAKIGVALVSNRRRFLVRDTIIDNNMMAAIPRAGVVDPRFLYYLLRETDFNVIAGGTALPYLNASDIAGLEVSVPNLNEQQAIAETLGAIDDTLEVNGRMNRTLEELAGALFRSWFVDFEPVVAKAAGRAPFGLAPEVAALFPATFTDSELGPIPLGWRVATIGDIAENPRRQVAPSQVAPETPYIGLEHMPRKSICLTDTGTAADVSSSKSRFAKGEILFGKLRPYFHKVGVAPCDGVCSTDVLVVTPRAEAWFGVLLGHLSSEEFVDYADAASGGTRMPRTSWHDMKRYRIALPPEPLAQKLTEHYRRAAAMFAHHREESRTLAALRDTLLPKLLSGELRVAALDEAEASA